MGLRRAAGAESIHDPIDPNISSQGKLDLCVGITGRVVATMEPGHGGGGQGQEDSAVGKWPLRTRTFLNVSHISQ